MANTTPPIPQRKSKHWLIIPIVAVVLTASIVGFWIGSHSLSNQQPSGTNQNRLTIASFNSTILDNESQIQAYLELQVGRYWVDGNTVYCTGTISWHTTEWTADGMDVALNLDRTGTPYTVDAEVYIFGGMLLLGQDSINCSSVAIPKLGDQIFSYDFSLNCTYHP